MTDHSSPRFGAARRNILAACLAAALTAGAAAHSQLSIAPSDRASPMFSGLAHAPRMADARNAAPAHPFASIPVTTCADAGTGSLREAAALANDSDEIDLRGLELLCSTITLESGAIALDVNATVQGPGSDALTIDGGGTDRVFYSTAGLTINDLTIAHGNHDGGAGGCIVAYGADLTLTRSVVTNCHAGDGSNAQSRGGGVYVGGILYMQASTISLSSAMATNSVYGGGAYVVGDVYLGASSIVGNTAAAQSGAARGGGLFTVFGSVNVYHRSRVNDNTAQSIDGTASGGGVSAGGPVNAHLSTVNGNTAYSESLASFGGGIHSDASGVPAGGSAIAIHGSTLSGNIASTNCGSCLAIGGGASALGPVLASYSVVRDNEVSAAGAAAGAAGGGLATVAADGRIVLLNSTVSGNSANSGHLGYGGGIASVYSLFIAYGSTVAFNEASHFGGGVTGNDGTLFSTIAANNEAPVGTAADLASGYPIGQSMINGSNNLVIASSAEIDFANEPLHADPLLLALADNGGLTATHALGAGSPAIDAGEDSLGANYDQRFCPYPREAGAAADIGAFEQQTEVADYLFGDDFEGGLPPCAN